MAFKPLGIFRSSIFVDLTPRLTLRGSFYIGMLLAKGQA
jgi:hypothetical protein